MKETFWQKIKRYFHGTFLFPHIKRYNDGIEWCTCGYRRVYDWSLVKEK